MLAVPDEPAVENNSNNNLPSSDSNSVFRSDSDGSLSEISVIVIDPPNLQNI